jgi:hypothetical protein
MRNKTEVDRRVKALAFWKKHGPAAALEACDVSRPTLFRWQKQLADSEGRLDALDPKSTAPKVQRKRIVPDGVEAFILREHIEQFVISEYHGKVHSPFLRENQNG